MNDEERRRNQRAAREGDAMAMVRENVEQARSGEGVVGFLEALIGTTVYIEGVRINYRGTLRRVLYHGDGSCAGLVLQPCQRVSYFERSGPQENYTYTHTEPRLVPYEMVHDVGAEGFAEGNWRKIGG